jgi:hypothetical protein
MVINTISLSLTLFLQICEGGNLLFSLLNFTQISCLFIHMCPFMGRHSKIIEVISLAMCIDSHHELANGYGVTVSQITTDIFHLS